jgi:type I restriction enzyme S subunit
LADHCHLITKGTTPTSIGFDFADKGVPFLRVGNISGGAVNFESDTLFVSAKVHDALKRSKIAPQDVLLSIAGSIGRAGVVPTDAPEMNCNQALAIIRAKDSICRPYLRHWLESQQAQAQIKGVTVTGTIQNLSLAQVGDLKVPLPDLEEQQRIAAILDQADALRAQRREALAQLGSLTQAIFIEMFGGDQAKAWPQATIADVVDAAHGGIRTGPFGSQLLHSEFVAEGIAVLGIDNAVANEFRWGERRYITEAKYRELKRYTVRPGDVLITIMGTCGRCAVVPDDIPLAINTKHLCCITLQQGKCLPAYLHAYFLMHPLAREYLERTAKGAIMAGLNMGLIKAMPLLVPPLARQQTFATRIQAVQALQTTHRTALAELDALFASLQHRAFSGAL